jgi:hypothetical protein
VAEQPGRRRRCVGRFALRYAAGGISIGVAVAAAAGCGLLRLRHRQTRQYLLAQDYYWYDDWYIHRYWHKMRLLNKPRGSALGGFSFLAVL